MIEIKEVKRTDLSGKFVFSIFWIIATIKNKNYIYPECFYTIEEADEIAKKFNNEIPLGVFVPVANEPTISPIVAS